MPRRSRLRWTFASFCQLLWALRGRPQIDGRDDLGLVAFHVRRSVAVACRRCLDSESHPRRPARRPVARDHCERTGWHGREHFPAAPCLVRPARGPPTFFG